MSNQLRAISPLDGRYAKSVKDLPAYFSESALMQYRLKVEIEYIIMLGRERSIKEMPPFSTQEQIRLRKIYRNFNTASAEKVKEIETTTNHDVKAIEYYIQGKTKKALHHVTFATHICTTHYFACVNKHTPPSKTPRSQKNTKKKTSFIVGTSSSTLHSYFPTPWTPQGVVIS